MIDIIGIIRAILSMPFAMLALLFDKTSILIGGWRPVARVEITHHRPIGYLVSPAQLCNDIEQARTAAIFTLNQQIQAEVDRAETPVRRETDGYTGV